MFSIIVPSYHRQAEIPPLLESLAQQTVLNFEVIIIDDCSIPEVKLIKDYPFSVKVIRNAYNLGAAQSRNVGVQNAHYDWLLFLDDDDRFLPEKCEVLAKTIQDNPDVNFIYHPAECVMVNEGFTYFTKPCQDEKEITLDNILKANKIGGMPMMAVKKSLFEQVGGLSQSLRSLEDYEFILKLISAPNFSPKYIDKPLTQCQFHTQRKSVSTNTVHTEQAIERIKQQYVKTATQAVNFEFNRQYMLAYPHIMHLSRKASVYYWRLFKLSHRIQYLAIALITFISPKLAINMKRFI